MFGENKVLAYIYNDQGKSGPNFVLSTDPTQIASFLVMTRYAKKVVITNLFDEMELCTMRGGFIDRCKDQQFLREKLLPILIPMQLEECSPEPLEIIDWGWSSEEVDQMGGKNEVIKWYNDQFYTDIIIK
jgi:hypothetical protein